MKWNWLPWNWGKSIKPSLGEPETFYDFLKNRMAQFGITTNDVSLNEMRYQWLDGTFAVERGRIDRRNTIVRISASREVEFKAQIEAKYQEYLQPWIAIGLPVPNVSVLTR